MANNIIIIGFSLIYSIYLKLHPDNRIVLFFHLNLLYICKNLCISIKAIYENTQSDFAYILN